MKTCLHLCDYHGEALADVLAALPGSATDVILCGPLPGSNLSEIVPWVYHPAVLKEWQDCGTYLGQEEDRAPTVALAQGERQVKLRWLSAWMDAPLTAEEARAAFATLDDLLARRFRNRSLNFASPVALGRHLMQSSWQQRGILVPPAPPQIRDLLVEVGPQGRHQCVTLPSLETIPNLYGYDMRMAYLWCCRGLPYGALMRTGGDLPDGHKMRCRWAAPDGWEQIGLLPERRQGWWYPRQGEGWLDRREYELAIRCGWEVKVLGEGLLWEEEGALDGWIDGIQSAMRDARSETVQRMLRRVALNALGSLHRSSMRRYRAVPASQPQLVPPANATLRLSADGGHYYWYDEAPISGRGLIYVHPEWTSTIWARCRARLTQAALQFPREQLVALRQDALFVTHKHPTWADDGAIGRFRCKEEYPGPHAAPRTLDEFDALRGLGG